MKDICDDVFGISKEKKDPKEIRRNRGSLDLKKDPKNYYKFCFHFLFFN